MDWSEYFTQEEWMRGDAMAASEAAAATAEVGDAVAMAVAAIAPPPLVAMAVVPALVYAARPSIGFTRCQSP
jgi:hypothetical protein